MQKSMTWLHLSDLHMGQSKLHLFPNIKDSFFRQLDAFIDKIGPIDIVFFTGDLANKGNQSEFDSLDKNFLNPLWDFFDRRSCSPYFFTVPGNHDLQRPDIKNPAARYIIKNGILEDDIKNEIWNLDPPPHGGFRQIIDEAFHNYQGWKLKNKLGKRAAETSGILPGDFSAKLEINGYKIGVVGLNTTAVQLSGDVKKGRLDIDSRQLGALCNQDAPKWVKQNNVNFLLTHQPNDWLSSISQKEMRTEICPPGRFQMHLYGHMHEPRYKSFSTGGGDNLREWQAPSMFGLEFFGEGREQKRIHGFTVGQLTPLNADSSALRFWPFSATSEGENGWRFVADNRNYVLRDDGGTNAEIIHHTNPLTCIDNELACVPAVSSGSVLKKDQTKPLVLFVDDEEQDRKYFKKIFESEYHVELASLVDEAFHMAEKYEKEGRHVTALVTDHRMPHKEGIELLQMFKARFPDAIRIMVTAFIDNVLLCNAINKGAINTIVEKPLEVNELKAILKNATLEHAKARDRSLALAAIESNYQYKEASRGGGAGAVANLSAKVINNSLWQESYVFQFEKSLEKIEWDIRFYLQGLNALSRPLAKLSKVMGGVSDYDNLVSIKDKLNLYQVDLRSGVQSIVAKSVHLELASFLESLLAGKESPFISLSVIPNSRKMIEAATLYYNILAKALDWKLVSI